MHMNKQQLRRMLAAVTLISSMYGCDGNANGEGRGDIFTDSSSDQAFNGPLTGDIWYRGFRDETHRFNLETGKSSWFLNKEATPSRATGHFTHI